MNCEHHDYTMVENYIRELQWSPGATEIEKALVSGNIRGFYEHLRKLGRTPPAQGGGGEDSLLNVIDNLRTGRDGTKYDYVQGRGGSMIHVAPLFTTQPQAGSQWAEEDLDNLAGVWEKSDLIGGETDAQPPTAKAHVGRQMTMRECMDAGDGTPAKPAHVGIWEAYQCPHDGTPLDDGEGTRICQSCGDDLPQPAIRLVIVDGPFGGRQSIRQWDNIGELPAGEYFLFAHPPQCERDDCNSISVGLAKKWADELSALTAALTQQASP